MSLHTNKERPTELFGTMENTDACNPSGLLVPDVNEDSVDIYDDLDLIGINAEKSPQDAFELKESMDLYEEFVTEEQRNRESSFAELKSRFQAAQNQIKELRKRLEEMEIQNTKLNTENCSLKKNISALFRTAKQEVTRKDAEIQRLNQRSLKGHQFYTNNQEDQNVSSSRPLTSSPPPTPSSPPPLTTSSPRENHPPRDPPQLSKEESNNCINQSTSSSSDKTRTSKQSSICHLKSAFKIESDKHKSKHRDEKHQSHKLSQSAEWRNRTGSDSNTVSHGLNKTKSREKDMDQKYDSRSCISKTYLDPEGHHRLDGSKSPQDIFNNTSLSIGRSGRNQEHRQDKVKLVTSDSERSKAHSSKERYSRDSRKSYSRSLNANDRIKHSSVKNLDKHRDSSRDREGERLSKDYQKKVERRREDEIGRKHTKNSLPETSRERHKPRIKDVDQGEADVCRKENRENKHGTLKKSSKERNGTEKRSVEENSPNKKLCFMETLNLTLSPIKKPIICGSQDEPPVDKILENQPDDENSHPSVEDMCVIDEVGSSQSEDVAEQTSDVPESAAKSFEFVKDVQKEDTRCSKSEAGKPLEDNSVLHVTHKQRSINPKPEAPQRNLSQVHDNGTELASESQVDKSEPLKATESLSDASRNVSKQHKSCPPQGNLVNNAGQPVHITEQFVPESREEPPKLRVQTSLPMDSAENLDSPLRESPLAEEPPGIPKIQNISSALLTETCQQGLSPPDLFPSVYKKVVCDVQSDSKETEAVSSTIGLDLFPQESLSLPEAIHIFTQTTKDDNDIVASKPNPCPSCIGVSKVSSTTEESALPQRYNELFLTPKKNLGPVKSHDNNGAPSSSVPLLHDDDSMMHTLSNLRRFPDAISPLRSPIRITKRSHLQVHVNPGQVKILQTDFSNTAVDVNSKKLDVNKENKYPGSPANSDMQNMVDKAADHVSCLSDTELEEGEILSENEETTSDSPVPKTKRAKLSQNKTSHKTVLKRKSEDRHLVSKETPGTSTQSPKSRFKTVCPAASKVSFSNIDEIMETFKLVRSEIRKKYMKLHKTFPKKSFYGMMDNFQESFLEFVDGAQFGQICSQAGELKCRLKKLIACIFSKVSNNGIVQRIFEQQANDLKQKLWDFVDVQVDYLFKDIHATLKSLCKPVSTQTKDTRPNGNESVSNQPSVKKPQCQKEFRSAVPSLSQIKTSAVVPYRTGLGSRGKDIRIPQVEKATIANPCPVDGQKTHTVTDIVPAKKTHSTPEKNNMVSLIVSQNGCLLDKTDFEILTEQQASSLTFNLVRDSQMGEIFKCLLQGSDLLESTGITEDSSAWPLNTPRKDGERLISISTPTKFDSPSKLLYPNKFDTPSKLIATWSSISPHKMSSPRSKEPLKLNPALFDESCLLEIPSDNRLLLQSSMHPLKSYSILTEDLAVSLTIPSPLKSDSHLSFLQPSSMQVMSTPDSVISAHISEDALMDGEDATEQDIHLILDTDNSSCGSSSSVASMACSTSFMFQPDKPMEALVMEKSNDHFIVKIRQADVADVTLTADDSLSKTIREEDEQHGGEGVAQEIHNDGQAKAALLNEPLACSSPSDAACSGLSRFSESSAVCQAVLGSDIGLTQDNSLTLTKDPSGQKEETLAQQSTSKVCCSEELQSLKSHSSCDSLHNGAQCFNSVCMHFSELSNEKGIALTSDEYKTDRNCGEEDNSSKGLISASNTVVSANIPQPAGNFKTNRSKTSPLQCSDSEREEIEASESERSLIIAEDMSSTPETDKRGCDKGRKRKKHREKVKAKRRRKEEEKTEAILSKRDSPASLSPNNLSAKNVVRKKGEVVMAWTRDEDRAILIELRTKGPSRETFSALSEKLKKPSGQVAHRFYQLMKLFKKQEKTDT